MATHPLKPLIRGMLAMLFVAGAVLAVRHLRLVLEEEAARLDASRRQAEEDNRRRQREREEAELASNLRREQQLRARELSERRAKEDASFAAAEAKKRPVDVGAALEASRRRAEAGDPEAQYLLGVIYQRGMDEVIRLNPGTRGMSFSPRILTPLTGEDLSATPLTIRFVSIPALPPNRLEAARWLERAARQGHREAQASLASLLGYEYADADPATAYKWALIADAGPALPAETKLSGHTPESRRLLRDRLNAKLTPAQKAEAEKLAQDFRPKKEKP